MAEHQITLPSITAVALSPNPCAASASMTISVTVTEIVKVLTPEKIYSGEIYSNEV